VALVILLPRLHAEYLPATPIRDSSQLLDVDVDQGTRVVTLVTTDDLTGRAIHPRQTIEPQSNEDSVDGRRRNAESVANSKRAEFEF
jgi:hypothetical protein